MTPRQTEAKSFSKEFRNKAYSALVIAGLSAAALTGCASNDVGAKPPVATEQPSNPVETQEPDPFENDPAGLFQVGLGHIEYTMGPRELDTGLEPIWLERSEALPSSLVEMYNEPLEVFIQRPKEEQWRLVSYLDERKGDFDLIYAAINRHGDYDPEQPVNLDSSAEQLMGYGASWYRFALSFIDKELNDDDPNTPPLVDRNEFLKILSAITYDPVNHQGFQQTIEESRDYRYYDVQLAARSKSQESSTIGYEILSRGDTYNMNGYLGVVDVIILHNDVEKTSKRMFFEYVDYKGNKAIGYQYTTAR